LAAGFISSDTADIVRVVLIVVVHVAVTEPHIVGVVAVVLGTGPVVAGGTPNAFFPHQKQRGPKKRGVSC